MEVFVESGGGLYLDGEFLTVDVEELFMLDCLLRHLCLSFCWRGYAGIEQCVGSSWLDSGDEVYCRGEL